MADQLQVAVTGASGLVGTRLCAELTAAGHRVWALRRGKVPANAGGEGGAGNEAGIWDVESGAIWTPVPIDVVIHLAGRNVAVRWSAKVKREAWDSRVPATEKLCGFLARLPAGQRPRALVMATAIGIYGDRGDEVLTEDSPLAAKGQSFLSDICLAWEAAAQAARDASIRVVTLRLGAVLSRDGGALAKMAGPVKWGLGGPVGSGMQWLPWVALTDLCRLMIRAATDENESGVINAVSPAPVRQQEFMRTLGKVLHRPTVFPVPSFMVNLMFGQMGREVLLSSSRVVGTRMPAGFAWKYATLEEAMRGELGK